MKKPRTSPQPDGASAITEVLRKSTPRPTRHDSTTEKKNYAIRFATHIGERLTADLKPYFPKISATTKRSARSVTGNKQLDVNFSTPELGLALGISLKSVHVRDVGSAFRYTHNMKRNEEELRIEASGYHKRQPYAVMLGVLFLPFDSCTDGKSESSSFGSWVRKLRPYAGRVDPEDDIDRFEKIYIALYEPDGSDLRFFDIQCAPPRNGRPPDAEAPIDFDATCHGLLSYADFLGAAYHSYLARNQAEFMWASGEEEPLDLAADDDDADDS
ncbi:MAG: hypothetical protein ACR2LU_00365 [Luteitalea sp.]